MKRKFTEHDWVYLTPELTVRITRANPDDAFGTTPHYGFVWADDRGDWQQGWMPVVAMDAIGIKSPGFGNPL